MDKQEIERRAEAAADAGHGIRPSVIWLNAYAAAKYALEHIDEPLPRDPDLLKRAREEVAKWYEESGSALSARNCRGGSYDNGASVTVAYNLLERMKGA